MQSDTRLLLSFVFAAHCALGCGNSGTTGGGGGGSNTPSLKSIAVTPVATTLAVGDTPQSVIFTATGTFTDGSSRDITNEALFTLSRPVVGTFNGSAFTSAGISGTVNVIASIGSVFGQATLTVTVDRKTIGPGVPSNAADLFGGDAEASRNPKVSTPYADTLIPPNIGMFEFAWDSGSGNNLWEFGLSCESFSLKTYLTTSTYVMTGADFTAFAESCRGKGVQIVVRGTTNTPTPPPTVGTSPAVSFALADEDVEGGVYYWSNACSYDLADYNQSVIYRFDFGAPKPAEAYYGPSITSGSGSSNGKCVGCHAVSRYGNSISLSIRNTGGGDQDQRYVLDAATRLPRFTSNIVTIFSVFSPDESMFINNHHGALTLYNTVNGSTVGPNNGQLPLSSLAAQPDWSLDGSTVAMVQYSDTGQGDGDPFVYNGSIATAPFDGANNSFGNPTTIVPGGVTNNNYYPCFTPDGAYILFNRAASGDSYSNDGAKLMVVRVTGGNPVELSKAEPPDHQRHSWPRTSPFLKHEKGDSLVWFTFSSNAKGQPSPPPQHTEISQIYMSALRLPANGGDPVQYASFHLPYQAADRCNHIAQWTEIVVPIEP